MRVIDVDTHVTPSVEVLMRYADQELKNRADDLKPYIRVMEPSAGRGHPEGSYEILRINPLPYNRMAGQKGAAKAIQSSGAGTRGALEGRVDNLAGKGVEVGVQHDNSTGRLRNMDVEGVDIDVIIPGTGHAAARRSSRHWRRRCIGRTTGIWPITAPRIRGG